MFWGAWQGFCCGDGKIQQVVETPHRPKPEFFGQQLKPAVTQHGPARNLFGRLRDGHGETLGIGRRRAMFDHVINCMLNVPLAACAEFARADAEARVAAAMTGHHHAADIGQDIAFGRNVLTEIVGAAEGQVPA